MSYMLTTIDNPFNPFDDFDSWFRFDTAQGYNTCGYLGRIILTSDSLSDADQEQARMDAINEIVRINPLGVWVKIEKNESPRG